MTGRTYRKYRVKRTCSEEAWQQRWLVGGGPTTTTTTTTPATTATTTTTTTTPPAAAAAAATTTTTTTTTNNQNTTTTNNNNHYYFYYSYCYCSCYYHRYCCWCCYLFRPPRSPPTKNTNLWTYPVWAAIHRRQGVNPHGESSTLRTVAETGAHPGKSCNADKCSGPSDWHAHVRRFGLQLRLKSHTALCTFLIRRIGLPSTAIAETM